MRFFDTLANLVTGLGLIGQDKSASTAFLFNPMMRPELDAAFRGDWLSRKIVTIPAFDMTREWRTWQAENATITKLEEAEKRWDLRAKVRKAITISRLYGGAAILMGDGNDPETPLAITGVDGLKYLVGVNRYRLKPGPLLMDDPGQEGFGEPEWWELNSATKGPIRFHPSRVVPFHGNELPDTEESAVEGAWGDSVLQPVNDAIRHALSAPNAAAALLEEAKVDVIKTPGLLAQVGTKEYRDRLIARHTLSQTLRGIANTTLLDDKEEWDRKETTFTGLPEIIFAFLQIVSGAADIPSTRLLNQSPAGMNATGESDMRNYYDMLASRQEADIRPNLDRLDDALLVSTLGTRPDDVFSEFAPLWQETEAQKAERFGKLAEGTTKLAATGLIPDKALARGLQARLIEDGTYPGLEAAIEEAEKELEAQGIDPYAPAQPGDPNDPNADPEAGGGPGAGGKGGAANENQEVHIQGKGGESIKVKLKRSRGARDTALQDAKPRTLYVSRRLLNTDELLEWATAQGFTTTQPAEAMHVTVAFSRVPVDWFKVGQDYVGDEEGKFTITPGGPRLVEPLGNAGAVVLLFAAPFLEWRHRNILEHGASWDWEGYQPHVTITWDAGALDLSKVEPYQGRLVFGPEVFQEVVESWAATITEVPAAG